MPYELEPFKDRNGNIRRCGSLVLPTGFVSPFPVFESKVETLDDAAIRRLIRYRRPTVDTRRGNGAAPKQGCQPRSGPEAPRQFGWSSTAHLWR